MAQGSPTVEIRDFSSKRKPVKFQIDGEKFDGVRNLSAPVLQQLAKAAEGIAGDENEEELDVFKTIDEKLSALIETCNSVLQPESAERFAKLAPTLDLQDQIIPLMMWLLEVYGLRPTTVSSESSPSSPTEPDGTTSTVGSSTEVSTSMI